MTLDHLTPEQWQQFEEDGYVKLGKLLSDEEVAALQARLDDIMLGKAELNYDRMVMQLEGGAGTYNKYGVQTRGFKGATLDYRVVYGLEYDPAFLRYMQHPLFRHICAELYGEETAVATYRAFVMNKPAHGGSDLGWHQDRWSFFDRDPLITIWTALDPATLANGCVEVVRGSHRTGPINPSHESGGITEEQVKVHCDPAQVVPIELASGEVALLHNLLLHSSAVNRTDIPRRGFSVCFMDAATVDARPMSERQSLVYEDAYPVIFGEGALEPEALAGGAMKR